MSSPTGNAAPNAFDKPGRRDAVLSLSTARQMLPLVQHIIQDLLEAKKRLAWMVPELERLTKERRTLAWSARCRRYQLQEDARCYERQLEQANDELSDLGLMLIDPELGQVGFPTMVNDRRAYFSWRPGENGVIFWHFRGESTRRSVPTSWQNEEVRAEL